MTWEWYARCEECGWHVTRRTKDVASSELWSHRVDERHGGSWHLLQVGTA